MVTATHFLAAAKAFLQAGPETPSGVLRRRLAFAAKLAVTLSAFWIVFALVDLNQALELVRDQSPTLVALAAIAIVAQVMLGALRWRAVLAASARQNSADISAIKAFQLFYASIFFNSFLPGTFGGDIVRVVSTRALGVSMGSSVHSVVLDRIIALIMLLLMALPAFPLVWSGIGMSATVLAVGLGLAIFGLLFYFLLGRIAWLASLKAQADRVIFGFWRALANLFARPGSLLIALPTAYGAHAAYCIAIYFIAKSLQVDISMVDTLTLVPLVLLVSALPISVGGWGVREVGAIGLLGLIGVSGNEAVTISVQFGLLSLLMSLPGGAFWLGFRSRRAT